MDEIEMKDQAIREYVNLQRIKAAKDQEAEIAYQENVLKTRMKVLGISTENLGLK